MKKEALGIGRLSICNRILLFSLIITLIPVISMGWLLNEMVESTVGEKCKQKQEYISTVIQKELTLWFKERRYDLYVFANSFVITENFKESIRTAANDTGDPDGTTPVSLRMVETYLRSLKKQFEFYSRLALLNSDGEIIVSSQSDTPAMELNLPEDYKQQLEREKYFHSKVYYSEQSQNPLMLIGTPLFTEKYDKYDGILVIEVQLIPIKEILRAAVEDKAWDSQPVASLVQLNDKRMFLSSNPAILSAQKSDRVVADIEFKFESGLHEFINQSGERVVGIFSPIKEFHWGIIVSEGYDEVYSRVIFSRNRNLVLVCLLGLGVGLLAYLLARQIIKPLQALTDASRLVAEGNLNVCLKQTTRDELGLATHVFNEMVSELRESQEELKKLATTDSLTGLANRKQIMNSLQLLYKYYKRHKHRFSVLMLDLDHFKLVNDTYGHLAGDAVLAGVGDILREKLRDIDSAGRYGGEEFLILLPESDKNDAKKTAERINSEISANTIQADDSLVSVTASIGIATVSPSDNDETDLIKRADVALYQAKRNGRNQYVYLSADNDGEVRDKVFVLKSPSQ